MPIRTVRRSLVPQPRVRLLKARRFSPPPPPATHEQNGGVSGDDTARPPPRQQRGKARASRVAQISLPVALTTTSLDANGNAISSSRFACLLGDETVATVDALTGPVNAVAAGAATITATSGSLSGTVTVTVVVPSSPTNVVSDQDPKSRRGASRTIAGAGPTTRMAGSDHGSTRKRTPMNFPGRRPRRDRTCPRLPFRQQRGTLRASAYA